MGEFLPLTANRKYVAQYALPPATYVRPFLFGGGAGSPSIPMQPPMRNRSN